MCDMAIVAYIPSIQMEELRKISQHRQDSQSLNRI
jgi:hypothetical protein